MVSLRSLVAGAALIAAPVMAALTATQLVSGLDSLKQQALALQRPASEITIVNAPLVIIGQGRSQYVSRSPAPPLRAGWLTWHRLSSRAFRRW